MTAPRRPNIVIIVADQHSPHVLRSAGDDVAQTPHLDRLARDGVRFASAYTGSPLCVPSRACFMTGRSCSEVRVWSNSCHFASHYPTFAHGLTRGGYDTVLCGRMHFTLADQRHGFTQRIAGDISGPSDGRAKAHLGDIPWASQGQSKDGVVIAGPGRTGFQAYDADVTRAAVEYLAQRGGAGRLEDDAAQVRPFCLVVGFIQPHNPYIAPRPLFDRFLPSVTLPERRPDFPDGAHPGIRGWLDSRQTQALTDEEIRIGRASYYGLVSLIDSHVGEIMTALEEAGLREETAVFYTSDHGGMLGEHGLWQKNYMYEASAGVPLIASWPGTFAAGHVVGDPVSLIDLAPTVLELGDAPPLPYTSGRVITPLLRGGEPDPLAWRPEIYVESMHVGGFPPSRMIRRGPWKQIHYHGFSTPQLFNLDEDPGELHDRAMDPSCQAIRDELAALVLDGWSGEAVADAVRQHVEDKRYVDDWLTTVHPVTPDLWSAPPLANVFPEEPTRQNS